MDRLIPAFNQIRDALASVQLELGAELPQIAVVGGQSVGKSSVLESLVGRGFLPTGVNVVTRRPLVLRLVHTPTGATHGVPDEWGEFGHLPGQRFSSFDEIRAEIAHDTDRVCGQQQAVSSEPIVLQILSPHVIDLTLVDLPGIARVPVGDQPQDIEWQLRQLILKHVAPPSCLILAVVAGNADLATADALAIAREVDPEGQRTIGVITKLDLTDSGCDLLGILEGRVYSLRQGFVGVVCRSFQGVKSGQAIKDQLQAEELFFRSHRSLRSVAGRCGIAFLSKRLNRILMDHLCGVLPDVKAKVLRLIHEHEAELHSYGEPVTGRPLSEQGALLLSLFTKFAGRFTDAIEGKLAGQLGGGPGLRGQLMGRARIDFIFRDIFTRTVRDSDTFSGLSDDEIRVAIRNATGPKATLFVPEAAFELLVRKQITKLLPPCLQCAELVFEELQRVLRLSEVPEFQRFVNLREKVLAVVRDLLRHCLEPTTQMVRDLIDVELAYVNTSHPEFVGGAGALRLGGTGAYAPGAAGDAAAGGAGRSPVVPTEPVARAHGTTPLAGGRQRGGAEAALSELPPSGGFFSALGIFRPQRGGLFSLGTPGASEVQPNGRTGSAALVGGLSGTPTSPQTGPRDICASSLRLPHVPQCIMPASAAPTQRERVEVYIIKMLLENYLAIVKKNIVDAVPKTVMHFMVNQLKDVIQRECVARLYKEEAFSSLLQEAPDVQGRRSRCSERLQALNRVIEVTEQLRDYSADVL
mmetsp:Transcript_65764/g.152796  ORF Transcript_65764/g.152796 Transcript_65764/m.152796 type:complete len:752 (-) Transcript_65764:100-2355(-)|eukprot:CAMPEP_0171146848 /NCGR_PEP_ID=MMETSP0766_2-20121228/147769_1 /TAXON_ID=439317 /ORGANISM="Gambierdiscus australes, Strain CAWD 149" /LENGTH=751 /DNA_ID=CAMNT_0011610755 /DNA_START=89 /DNA_END=2344 /DNA_ORIENTATION=+